MGTEVATYVRVPWGSADNFGQSPRVLAGALCMGDAGAGRRHAGAKRLPAHELPDTRTPSPALLVRIAAEVVHCLVKVSPGTQSGCPHELAVLGWLVWSWKALWSSMGLGGSLTRRCSSGCWAPSLSLRLDVVALQDA